MKEYKLKEPTYLEPDRNSVLLVLENDIENRSNVKKTIGNEKIEAVWNELSYIEQKTIEYIMENDGATREEISSLIGRAKTSTVNLLNRLVDMRLIAWTGTSKKDKLGKYIIR